MSTKLRLAVGPVELEAETDTEISITAIKSLLSEVATLSISTPAEPAAAGGDEAMNAGGGKTPPGSSAHKLFVTSIAAKLDVKSGPDLALAAAAYLQITEAKESFTRQELLLAMKKAPKFYKSSMSGNLTSIISSLIPSKLNQIGEGVYSLTAAEHSALEAKLA